MERAKWEVFYSRVGTLVYLMVWLPLTGLVTLLMVLGIATIKGGNDILHNLVTVMMVFFCLHLLRLAWGVFMGLKGGDVPAAAFAKDKLVLNDAIKRYELKPGDIKKISTVGTWFFTILVIRLQPPYEYRTLLGLPLKRISVMLPLASYSKKAFGKLLLAWNAGELPLPEAEAEWGRERGPFPVREPAPAMAAAAHMASDPPYEPVVGRRASGGFGRRVRR